MAKIDLIVDIGSSNINIYKLGEGLVLREPSLVILQNNKNVVAYGAKARDMLGTMPQNCQAICPIVEGSIKYPKMTVGMLDDFISRGIRRKEYFVKPKLRIYANIPCGSSREEKKIFEEILFCCGAKEVYLVESPLMALYGACQIVPTKKYIADIGGGITDIAYVDKNKIVFGKSYGIGGFNIDQGICDCVETAYGLQVGISTAESIKLEIGTLFANEHSEVRVKGKNTLSQNPRMEDIKTDGVRGALEFFYGKIADIIMESFKSLTVEVQSQIKEEGIFVVGGGACMFGLREFLEKRLEIEVFIPEKPALCAVMGGGRLLQEEETLEEILNLGKEEEE